MGVRERLLDSADELFYAHGITATGVDKISAHAGVAKMSLYKHFTSKDGLIAAYLSGRDESWRNHLSERLLAAGPDPVARLHTVVAAYEDRILDPAYRGCSFLNAVAELPATHPARGIVTQHKRQISERLRQDLADAGAEAPEALAARLFTLLEGVLAVGMVDPAGPTAGHAVQWAHRLIDDAVAATSGH